MKHTSYKTSFLTFPLETRTEKPPSTSQDLIFLQFIYLKGLETFYSITPTQTNNVFI